VCNIIYFRHNNSVIVCWQSGWSTLFDGTTSTVFSSIHTNSKIRNYCFNHTERTAGDWALKFKIWPMFEYLTLGWIAIFRFLLESLTFNRRSILFWNKKQLLSKGFFQKCFSRWHISRECDGFFSQHFRQNFGWRTTVYHSRFFEKLPLEEPSWGTVLSVFVSQRNFLQKKFYKYFSGFKISGKFKMLWLKECVLIILALKFKQGQLPIRVDGRVSPQDLVAHIWGGTLASRWMFTLFVFTTPSPLRSVKNSGLKWNFYTSATRTAAFWARGKVSVTWGKTSL